MIHCREDYNRIQEPDELLNMIDRLESYIKSGEDLTDGDVAELTSLRHRYDTRRGSKIGDDEPVFMVRGKDIHFVPVLEHYAKLVREDPEGDQSIPVLVEGWAAGYAAEWQEENPTKSPDLTVTTPS